MKYIFTLLACLLSASAYSQTLPTLALDALKTELGRQDDTLRIANFWATWCKPCVEELPDFIALASQYRAEGRQVKFLLIAVEDTPEKVNTFLKNKKMNPNPLFYVLTERDANKWIPAIDAKWEGEIPATLFVNDKTNLRAFYPKKFSHTELENTIHLHEKKK